MHPCRCSVPCQPLGWMKAEQSIHKAVAALVERGLLFERLKQAPWVEVIESRLGFKLPASLRALIVNYSFPAMKVGNIELFANFGDNAEDDLTVAPFKDRHLSKWLQVNHRVQFARPSTGSYDPICLESRAGESTPVEAFDHEDILLERKKVRSILVSPSLEELLLHAAA